MGLDFNVNCAYNNYNGKGKESSDLLKILTKIKNESSIDTIKKAAYLLGTFAIESHYTANTFEAYYLVKDGETPDKTTSQGFINYMKGKTYSGGRYPNGVPIYLGRGLIQITNDYNYKTYDSYVPGLLANPNLALQFDNAWIIALQYVISHKTLIKADNGDLIGARKSVNGGTNNIDDVNKNFNQWITILTNCNAVEHPDDKLQPNNSTLAANGASGTGTGTNSSAQSDAAAQAAFLAKWKEVSGILSNQSAADQAGFVNTGSSGNADKNNLKTVTVTRT